MTVVERRRFKGSDRIEYLDEHGQVIPTAGRMAFPQPPPVELEDISGIRYSTGFRTDIVHPRPLWDWNPVPFGKWFLRRIPLTGWDEGTWGWALISPTLYEEDSGATWRVFTSQEPGKAHAAALAWMRGERS